MREPATSTEAEILKNTSNGVFRNFRTDIVNKRCGDSRINECYNVLTEAKSACAKAQALRSKRRFESSHFDQSNRRQAVFLLKNGDLFLVPARMETKELIARRNRFNHQHIYRRNYNRRKKKTEQVMR